MSALFARLKVLLAAAPTYLAAAGVIVAIASDEIGKLAPSGWQDNAIQILGAVAGVIATAIAIVRRVMPVAANQRGLLVKDAGLGLVEVILVIACLAIVFIAIKVY